MPSPKHATDQLTIYERAGMLATDLAVQHHIHLRSTQREWLIRAVVALATDHCKDRTLAERKQCEELGDLYVGELTKHYGDYNKSWFLEGYIKAITDYQEAIRNMKEDK